MKDFVILLVVLTAIFFGITSCENSEWSQQQKRDRAAKEAADRTPHVIREADGCKVYAFKENGRTHYFTRCPDSRTTTESSWEECHQVGKILSCNTQTETIDAGVRFKDRQKILGVV